MRLARRCALWLSLTLAAVLGPLAGTRATAAPPIDVLFVGYYRSNMLDQYWLRFKEACAREGVRVHVLDTDRSGLEFDQYPPELLRKFQAIVVLGPVEDTTSSQLVAVKGGLLDRLDQYSREGGGVLWVPLGEGRGALKWAKGIGSRYDLTCFEESVYDPPKTVTVTPVSGLQHLCKYVWTTDITPHPVTQGVTGLFLPLIGEWSWEGTVPMKYGPSWQVLVRGMDSTRTIRNAHPISSGNEDPLFDPSLPGTYAASPEIVGVREGAGAGGRMMVLPFHVTWTWANFGHPGLADALMLNGDGFHASQGMRLLVNGFKWLAEPAARAGFGGYQEPPVPAPDLSPVDWKHAEFPAGSWSGMETWWDTRTQRYVEVDHPAGQDWRGLVGARTGAGGGSGSVAEWVAEAQRLGLNFLVFTEDPAKLTQDSLAQLVQDCKAASNDNFAAVPGFAYRDAQGYLMFDINTHILPVADNFLPDGRVKQPQRIVYQHEWRVGHGMAELGAMKIEPYWHHVIWCAAPYVFDGGKMVDDGFARWLTIERNGQNMAPISLVRVDRPADLAGAVSSAYLTVINAPHPSDIVTYTGGGSAQPWRMYLSNGPRLVRWGVLNVMGLPFRPGGNQFRLGLEAESDAGLREVKIVNAYDGSLYRRYDPQGAKHFSVTVDESHARQWYLVPVVTDMAGRVAVGSSLMTYQDGNRLWLMGDRFMGLAHVIGWDTAHQRLLQFGAWGGGFHKLIPEAGANPTNPQDDGLAVRGIDGGHIYCSVAAVNPAWITAAGREPQQPAYRYSVELASFDNTVVDYVGDTQYPAGTQQDFYDPPAPTVPMTWADITSRQWAVRARYNAPVSATIYEITAVCKKAVNLQRFQLLQLRKNQPEAPDEYDQLFLRDNSGAVLGWRWGLGEPFSRAGVLGVGDYLYPCNLLGGAAGAINLGPTAVNYRSDGRGHDLFLGTGGRLIQPGERLSARVLVFTRAWPGQRSNQWLEQFRRDFGIGVPPGYQYQVRQGKLAGIDYIMELQADRGGATVELGKYALPHNLPLRVHGLAAGDPAVSYDLDTRQARLLPVYEGTVTTSTDLSARAKRLYVGLALSCGDPRVRLSLVPNGTDWLLEVHNPGTQAVTVHVAGVPGFAPLAAVNLTLTLPAGSSVKQPLTSAPETVKVGALEE